MANTDPQRPFLAQKTLVGCDRGRALVDGESRAEVTRPSMATLSRAVASAMPPIGQHTEAFRCEKPYGTTWRPRGAVRGHLRR